MREQNTNLDPSFFPKTMRKFTTLCNLCSCSTHAVVIDGRFGKIAKCNQCGLMFRITATAPHPVEHAGGADRLAQQYELKQRIQIRDYEKCLPIIDNHLAGSSRDFLEIGSHTGHFLNLARTRGWRVRGIEPDPNYARQSVEEFGFDVDVSDLRGAKLPDESFDAIVMFHVIEHFLDPVAELAAIHRVLRKDGILVAETPRYDTIWFKVLKERERSVIPDHFFFFTRRTLSDMVTRAGFSVLRLDSVGRTLTLDRLAGGIAKVIDSGTVSRFIVRTSDFLRLNRLTLHVNTHDMMRIYAQKK